MNNKEQSISKPNVSMTEMAKMLQMSRARLYQLLEQGFFPRPKYDDRSKRPFYDLELQKKCSECRQSGIGIDGSFMLFYSPRKKENISHMRRKKVDPVVKELTETLQEMGLETTAEQVQQGLAELYPDGTDGVEQGLVVRESFRHFKQQE